MNNDIICISETHVGLNYSFSLDDFIVVKKERTLDKSQGFRGGLAIAVRRSIKKGITFEEHKCSEMMWLRIDKSFFNLEKFLIRTLFGSYLEAMYSLTWREMLDSAF